MREEKIPSITAVKDLAGTYVLLRTSLNVPITHGAVRDDFRIKRALLTIRHLTNHGARVIIVAHIGRKQTETLRPVYDELQKIISVKWCDELLGERAHAMRGSLQDGEALMLENTRSYTEETQNDSVFAQSLAAYADIFVNDAFPDSHREHASIVGIPKYLPSYFGINFCREYEALSRARIPVAPSFFMLGGAKFETKLPLVQQYLSLYDKVFIGGALAHDIWRAKGYEIGTSLVSDTDLDGQAFIEASNLILPADVVVQTSEYTRITTPDDVNERETIVDAGPKTIEMLSHYIETAQTILWNGTLGNYEAGFAEGTKHAAKLIAAAQGYSIIGGGDTVASISALTLDEQFGFVSTAGGAMLSFLEKGSLPAIDAVLQ